MAGRVSFFDPALLDSLGGAFIREDKIDEALARLIPKARLTKGHFSYPATLEARDLVWNHMDQNHRPFIHRTYGDAMRIAISERLAFSLTRFGNWPMVLPVFDGQHKENGFYQVITLLGVLVVINVIECNGKGRDTRMDISWVIASHRFLRFLHRPLDRRLRRLNLVQNQEDDQMRDRRLQLRSAGYEFATDDPNFINSNKIANNVIFPHLTSTHSVSIADLAEGVPRTIEVGDRAYVVRRFDDEVDVWPGVCPHEGAALSQEDIDGRSIKCRWHGLEFPARRLKSGSVGVAICGARLDVRDGVLRIQPQQVGTAEA